MNPAPIAVPLGNGDIIVLMDMVIVLRWKKETAEIVHGPLGPEVPPGWWIDSVECLHRFQLGLTK